jgi:hypothetical protein
MLVLAPTACAATRGATSSAAIDEVTPFFLFFFSLRWQESVALMSLSVFGKSTSAVGRFLPLIIASVSCVAHSAQNGIPPKVLRIDWVVSLLLVSKCRGARLKFLVAVG